jgi:hypothetical protein
MTCNFRVFAPNDTLEYYTEDAHKPKYLTPLTLDGAPRIFKVRSNFQSPENTHPAVALFKHHETYNIPEPQIDSFLVKGFGIIPAKHLKCIAEMDYSYKNFLTNENKENTENNEDNDSMLSSEEIDEY